MAPFGHHLLRPRCRRSVIRASAVVLL